MSQYLVLSKIEVQNANAIAGFTWGFPAITQFLGFTHALSRKISVSYEGTYNTGFVGCMVVANKVSNKVYQPKPYADFEFLQSKTPPVLAKHKAASPPIIEEGKLNATLSLVLELSDPLLLTTDQVSEFENKVKAMCLNMRIAGGSVLSIGKVKLFLANNSQDESKQLSHMKRLCMPGFVLKDRSDYLEKHTEQIAIENNEVTALAAWLDFSSLKFSATPKLAEGQTDLNDQTDATWQYLKKPFDGYLVPIMAGYKAIAQPLTKEEVLGLRVKPDPEDQDVKAVAFVEAVHSVAEWISMHKVAQLSDYVWRYHQDGEWYLCQQESKPSNDNNAPLTNTDLFNNLF
ncbi:type I-F CRISPR-associated protein Csy2 [Pseudoalteromonas citrea]|uniref:Type I-F CRISPR-associated protein Csy2 n=1 Tax=Pseudoalteromonas citrea TaxID=43655 RepID=A0A5S3XG62_9GAMM|nr:type I-F CRISPR-associated protein Csy2 [Pseudoalteromonas citrea]TMP39756.1 type I-F CRISPR-associated protein Csy2 [Pseudoalteromonas citrea]TMP52115.1 type I-F CRISPR-associated protein Csy2 [Pseudoalteromonas citrea]